MHTAGKNKSTLDPFLDEKKEDIERLKNIQLDLHKDFHRGGGKKQVIKT